MIFKTELEKLLSKIDTRIKYINSNTENPYIAAKLNIVRQKLSEIKSHKYTTIDMVNKVCDNIKEQDIDRIRGLDNTKMVNKKIQELTDYISEIPYVYDK